MHHSLTCVVRVARHCELPVRHNNWARVHAVRLAHAEVRACEHALHLALDGGTGEVGPDHALAEVDDDVVRAVRHADLPVRLFRAGCGTTLSVAVEVIDAKPAIATEAASAAGIVDAGVALAVPAVAEAAVAVGSEACAIVEDGVRVGVGRDAGAEVEGSRAEAVLAALAAGALVAETREQCQEVVDVRRAVAIDVARGVRAEGREQQEQVWEQEQVCEWHAGAGAGLVAGAGL